MFKSGDDLVREIKKRNKDLTDGQVEQVVENLTTTLRCSLVEGRRIEIRDFAAFKVSHYSPRKARNPRTGESIFIGHRFKPTFQPGKKLREIVNSGLNQDAT